MPRQRSHRASHAPERQRITPPDQAERSRQIGITGAVGQASVPTVSRSVRWRRESAAANATLSSGALATRRMARRAVDRCGRRILADNRMLAVASGLTALRGRRERCPHARLLSTTCSRTVRRSRPVVLAAFRAIANVSSLRSRSRRSAFDAGERSVRSAVAGLRGSTGWSSSVRAGARRLPGRGLGSPVRSLCGESGGVRGVGIVVCGFRRGYRRHDDNDVARWDRHDRRDDNHGA
jgi:hypothetical protein